MLTRRKRIRKILFCSSLSKVCFRDQNGNARWIALGSIEDVLSIDEKIRFLETPFLRIGPRIEGFVNDLISSDNQIIILALDIEIKEIKWALTKAGKEYHLLKTDGLTKVVELAD